VSTAPIQVPLGTHRFGRLTLPQLQVGPDGALYQLRISPATGALIVRYPL